MKERRNQTGGLLDFLVVNFEDSTKGNVHSFLKNSEETKLRIFGNCTGFSDQQVRFYDCLMLRDVLKTTPPLPKYG